MEFLVRNNIIILYIIIYFILLFLYAIFIFMETSIYSYICILIYLVFEFFSSFIYIYILNCILMYNCILISENICNHVPTTIDTCLDIGQYFQI